MAGVRLIMANDAEVIGEKLTALLGSATKQRFGEGESRVEVQRWDWAGHAFLLSHVPNEVRVPRDSDDRVRRQPGNTARVSDAVIRERARGFVESVTMAMS